MALVHDMLSTMPPRLKNASADPPPAGTEIENEGLSVVEVAVTAEDGDYWLPVRA